MIIGFHGKLHSGKDTAADILKAKYGFQEGRFAGALKQMLWAMYAYTGMPDFEIERRIYGDLKETPCKVLNGQTPRHAMQLLGTEWGRQGIYNNVWVDLEMTRVKLLSDVVFTDVRFDNEAIALREAGGLVVDVIRPGYKRPEESAGHVSEGGISPELIDHTLYNDADVPAFHDKVLDWFEAIR